MQPSPEVLFLADFLPNADSLFSELVATTTWDNRLKARRTASFGVPYNYSGMIHPEVPIPETLLPLQAQLAQVLEFAPNNCLVNYYPDGRSTMGFHRDDTAGLAPSTGVAIVSLGATRTLVFRQREFPDQTVTFPLANGSLLYMPPAVQDTWQHGLPKEPHVPGGRISLTFRQVGA